MKSVLRISTIVTLIMLTSASLTVHTMASANLNWLPTTTGIELATPSPTQESRTYITKTSDNYFVIVWADDRNGNWDIFAQKLDGTGAEQWTAGGLGIVTGTGNQPANLSSELQISIVPDGIGGVIIAYSDENDNESLYVKKIDSTGTTSWTTGPISSITSSPTLIADGSEGAYLTWEALIENPPSSGNYSANIYATHLVGVDGVLDWNSGQPISVAVSNDDEKEPSAVLTSDGIAITYEHYYNTDPDEYYGIRASKVAFTGNINPSWNPYVTVATDSMTGINDHQTISDGTDGIIVTYQYNVTDIKAQKITYNSQTESYEMAWGANGIDVSNATNTQSQPQIINDSNGNAIIAWLDTRSGTQEIYAQKIGSDGSASWAVNGINISTEALPKYMPRLTSNGGTGVIITYIQTDVALTESDIKAQLLDSSGNQQWGTDGIFVETYSDSGNKVIDLYPEITGNNNGGAAITWLRQTTLGGATDIHAQYVTDSASGFCLEPGSESFCGTQVISSSTLTFTEIPDSFNFGAIQNGATNHNCTNGSNISSPAYTCSTDQTPIPGVDDMLKVYDDRNSGGFLVNVQPLDTFSSENADEIPLTNLYVLTTLPEDPSPGTNDITNGITYSDGAAGEQGIVAPAFVNEFAPDYADISVPETYTDPAINAHFGDNPVVLMDGTLNESLGRSGYFSQYVNYYLTTTPTQPAGNYSIVLFFDLMDSTTL